MTKLSQYFNVPILITLASVFFGFFAATTLPIFNDYSLSPGRVLIIGDSITALAVNKENRGFKGWWEYLLTTGNEKFEFSAVNGSGYVTKGTNGQTFHSGLTAIGRLKPAAIIIAGGLNDEKRGDATSGIKAYYDELSKVLAANKIPPRNVYVFVPRPNERAKQITKIVRYNAHRIGAQFVDTGAYTHTYDNIHPNSAGAKEILSRFKAKSDFDERLKSE